MKNYKTYQVGEDNNIEVYEISKHDAWAMIHDILNSYDYPPERQRKSRRYGDPEYATRAELMEATREWDAPLQDMWLDVLTKSNEYLGIGPGDPDDAYRMYRLEEQDIKRFIYSDDHGYSVYGVVPYRDEAGDWVVDLEDEQEYKDRQSNASIVENLRKSVLEWAKTAKQGDTQTFPLLEVPDGWTGQNELNAPFSWYKVAERIENYARKYGGSYADISYQAHTPNSISFRAWDTEKRDRRRY